MDQQTIVGRLVEQHYHFHHVILRSMYPQTFDGWGLYTVEADNEHSYVLQAYRYDDVEATLLGQVAVLRYLELHGYCQQRKLRNDELDLLLPVLRYLIAQRAPLEDRFLAFHDHWQEDIQLQRMLARSAASEEIAHIAFHCFTSQHP